MVPQFENCYWMIGLALPLGPLALEYMGLYQTSPPRADSRSYGAVSPACFSSWWPSSPVLRWSASTR